MKEREHYGFEYSGVEDPSRMVPTLELTDEEVLKHLQKMLKGVSVVLLAVLEYSAKNPPPTVSYSFLYSGTFDSLSLYPLLLNLPCLVVLLFYRNWGIISLIQFPLMISLQMWRLGVVLLGHPRPVSLKLL